MKKKISAFDVILHAVFFLMCMSFIIPLLLVVSASFTSESWLTSGNGFSLLPKQFTVAAYRAAFSNAGQMLRAYAVTIAQAVIGTVLSCIISGMIAYPLSRSNFRFKKGIVFFVFFTMLFSAGMIPSYIIFAKVYHISNNFLIYILPGITGGAWNTMVFRTFFKSLPESLFEAAHLDGARELKVFFEIVVPLSTPVFASIGFMTLVGKWNDYTTSMIYIRDEKLYTLQYLLQRLMDEANFLKSLSEKAYMMGNVQMDMQAMPSETLKYALCIIAAGPMLVVFPFFQKYFAQGLTIGGVKE